MQVKQLMATDAATWRPDTNLAAVASMNDVVLAARQKGGPAATEIVAALSAICAHASRPGIAAA